MSMTQLGFISFKNHDFCKINKFCSNFYKYHDYKMCEGCEAFDMSKFDMQLARELYGRKNDIGKLRMDLITAEFMRELAKVLTLGASKYGDKNWAKGIKWGRVFGACLRHLYDWLGGEKIDPESGLSHLAHAVCNLMFLITYEQRHMEEWDDLHTRTDT